MITLITGAGSDRHLQISFSHLYPETFCPFQFHYAVLEKKENDPAKIIMSEIVFLNLLIVSDQQDYGTTFSIRGTP